MIASSHMLLIPALLLGAAMLLLLAESIWPKRMLQISRWRRWRTHIGFATVNLPVERLIEAGIFILLFGSIAGAAGLGAFGLLAWIDAPVWIEALIAIALLDLAVWFQHILTHRIALLWRLHRVHHADRDIDMSTALRFHPLEIALSMLFKLAVAVAIGASLSAVIMFELLLSVLPLFNHANLALPAWLDRVLRIVVVTPDMHRVHHSVERAEHDSNYGFCLSIWDRIFATYIASPSRGHDGMSIGLADYRDEKPAQWGWSMLLPFR